MDTESRAGPEGEITYAIETYPELTAEDFIDVLRR